MKLFSTEKAMFQLNPSYEPTNYPGSKEIGKEDLKRPYFQEENGKYLGRFKRQLVMVSFDHLMKTYVLCSDAFRYLRTNCYW